MAVVQKSQKQPRRRSVRVTAAKAAAQVPPAIHAAFAQDPRDGVRSRVALMASDASTLDLLDTAAFFLYSVEELEELAISPGQMSALSDRVRPVLESRGVSPCVRPLPVQRLRGEEHNGYPLRRTMLVVFNRDSQKVTAEFKEVADVLGIQGVGIDEENAFRDLERQFDQVVRTRVRIPPHAREDRDELVRKVVDHLVDWENFAQENPLPRLLWGRIVDRERSGQLRVHWLFGPGELRDQSAILPRLYATPYFDALKLGDWFQGVVKEYPGRVEWISPPTATADPSDPANREATWQAIPRIIADEPDVWPLKDRS